MATRIPGQQPTFGLERWFLPGDPGWMPVGVSSAGGVLAPTTGFLAELADRQVSPSAANLAGDQTIPTDAGAAQDGLDGRASAAAILADRVNSQRGDRLAPSFPGVQDAINRSGQGIGSAPGVIAPAPPPVPGENPSDIEAPTVPSG